jgi:hypothetical protein
MVAGGTGLRRQDVEVRRIEPAQKPTAAVIAGGSVVVALVSLRWPQVRSVKSLTHAGT